MDAYHTTCNAGETSELDAYGLMNYFTDDFLEKAGCLIDLNYKD